MEPYKGRPTSRLHTVSKQQQQQQQQNLQVKVIFAKKA